MDNTFYPKQVKEWILSIHRSVWISLIAFFSTISFSININAQCVVASKDLVGVNVASSGIAGNIDVSYRLRIRNPNGGLCPIVSSINIIEQLNSASNLGNAFVRVVGSPNISASGASIAPTSNPGFNGAGNPNMTNSDGFLLGGDSLVVNMVVEVNPRAVGAPGALNNNATITSGIPQSSAVTNIVTIPNCWSNCQMACNNTIHLSVNSNCEADLLADMVLEGDYATCADLGFFTVSLTYNGVPVSLPLNKSYVGKKLIVTVKNIVCGNTCWGNVLIEDKTPPLLNCKPRDTFRCNVNLNPLVFGFPVNPALVNTSVYPYIVNGIDACGTVSLTYRDSTVTYTCADTLASTVYRKWCATDAGGFTACCTDTIDIVRGTLADLTLPPHYDGQPGNNPALRCNGNWTKFPNGLPDTTSTGTGRPQGLLCGNIQFDFSDDTLRVCDGTIKILRKWLIIDWCRPNNRITYIQLIKIIDDVRPAVICPTTITINTSPNTCTGSYVLPVPENLLPGTIVDNRIPYVIETCSRWTYSVSHLPATSPTNCVPDPNQVGSTRNITKLPNGQYRVDNMPYGCNWIYYKICDDCGNCTECSFDIEVKDLTPPVAVCQQRTVVALTENGQATVSANVFDDRSHDNCEMGSFMVRRMNPGPCGSNNNFSNTITFCCSDIANNPIRVILKVTDKAGNTSECMVEVMVQDKLPPRTTCPKDTVVTCETDLSNLNVFGTATATDNCSVSIEQRIENNLSACNVGTIKRWFIATDAGGRKDSCSQLITVYDKYPFTGSDIVWPRDTNLVGCKNTTGISITGKPIYNNLDKCNQIVSNYDDLVFNYVEGVCYKILRKWTVIDWCTYDVNNPKQGNGVWYHTQVIKIVNNEKPTISSSCSNRQLCITEGCNVTAVLSASATDDCTDPSELLWTYALDRGNNNSVDLTGNGKTFAPSLVAGVHKVTWTVSDQCGNSSSCSYLITVIDCKAPTPYCNSGIVTVIMPSSKEITIWAKDFNLASSDNCTNASDLKYSFTSSLADSFKVIRCSDLRNGRVDTFNIDIYVTDLSGNQDLCHTKLIVQDNQDVCPNRNVNTVTVSGLITGVNKINYSPGVSIQFLNMDNHSMLEKSTDQVGQYAFEDLQKDQSYSIKPNLDVDPLNGVTTRDIIAIQRHILGKELINNPYYLIAADVNKSSSITSRDIADIRKLILGVTTGFPNNTSWNFVDANFQMDSNNPFAYVSNIDLANVNSNVINNNFIAVKTGDVTGEALTGNVQQGVTSRSKLVTGVELNETVVRANEKVEIALRVANDLTIEGMQFELNLNGSIGIITGVHSRTLDIQSDHYFISQHGKSLRVVWNNDSKQNIQSGTELFTIEILPLQNGIINASNLTLNNSGLNAEIYVGQDDYGMELLFRNGTQSDRADFELYQNVPNPFSGKTTVYYKVPFEQEVTLKIFDVSGKQIKQLNVNALKGLNATEIELQNENAGVLYYQLDARDFIATRKMVIIK